MSEPKFTPGPQVLKVFASKRFDGTNPHWFVIFNGNVFFSEPYSHGNCHVSGLHVHPHPENDQKAIDLIRDAGGDVSRVEKEKDNPTIARLKSIEGMPFSPREYSEEEKRRLLHEISIGKG